MWVEKKRKLVYIKNFLSVIKMTPYHPRSLHRQDLSVQARADLWDFGTEMLNV